MNFAPRGRRDRHPASSPPGTAHRTAGRQHAHGHRRAPGRRAGAGLSGGSLVNRTAYPGGNARRCRDGHRRTVDRPHLANARDAPFRPGGGCPLDAGAHDTKGHAGCRGTPSPAGARRRHLSAQPLAHRTSADARADPHTRGAVRRTRDGRRGHHGPAWHSHPATSLHGAHALPGAARSKATDIRAVRPVDSPFAHWIATMHCAPSRSATSRATGRRRCAISPGGRN